MFFCLFAKSNFTFVLFLLNVLHLMSFSSCFCHIKDANFLAFLFCFWVLLSYIQFNKKPSFAACFISIACNEV